ncbi:MAG: hypothetical protein B6229_08610 [Spirochaetaceae bacterium 4572_7]|nr:MAG: hypothetical protein B6229_08610 [Spirochaetaceae bacterium 4572_7]
MTLPLQEQEEFIKFCEIDIDREAYIISMLNKRMIPYSVIQLKGARHIFLYPGNFRSSEEITILMAHYDRVPGTPGANDNSAAIFYLLNHGSRILNKDHSTVIIFTDREEIGGAESVTEQGAYALGHYFRSKNLTNFRFFILDMCGIGTTLLLGTAGESLIKKHYGDKYDSSQIKLEINKVKKNAEETLLSINSGEFFYLTPLFSDDLGLILNEYPSILISLLPYREAVKYKEDHSKLPLSWQCNHSINDSVETLDPKSWNVLSPLLNRLSGLEDTKKETKLSWSFKCYTQNISDINRPNKIKPLINYLITPIYPINHINSSNITRLHEFIIFSSKIDGDFYDYLKVKLKPKTEDITPELLDYIVNLVDKGFNLLPLPVKDEIKKRSSGDIVRYLYANTIKNISERFIINSTPVSKKRSIILKLNSLENNKYIIDLNCEDKNIGSITILKDTYGFVINRGEFISTEFLKLDPLNMLKGIRLLLIKWLKLNNNESLRINLEEQNWIGCYQLFRLISMELDGRISEPIQSKLFYIWKRFYGKQS